MEATRAKRSEKFIELLRVKKKWRCPAKKTYIMTQNLLRNNDKYFVISHSSTADEVNFTEKNSWKTGIALSAN